MTMIPILLVDDDVELCSSLSRLLGMEGFSVTAVHDAESGLQRALQDAYEIVVLDVMLPGGDGRLVLRKIRRDSQVPIIMLTARGDEADRISGLEGGADDYLPKPFNPRELLARMRAILKRKGNGGVADPMKLVDLEIHRRQRRVFRLGEEITLTGAEFDVLVVLAQSAGRVLSREEIAKAALGRPLGFSIAASTITSAICERNSVPTQIRESVFEMFAAQDTSSSWSKKWMANRDP